MKSCSCMVIFALPVLIGCEEPVDTGPKNVPQELPPEDTSGVDLIEDTGWVFGDTGDLGGPTNLEPQNTLQMTHEAWLNALPQGGPYDSISGDLTITEVLDGNEAVPWCTVTFQLTGELVQEEADRCAECDYTFSVLFTLIDEGDPNPDPETEEKNPDIGGLAACASPDVPEDGETRVFGFDSTQESFLFNYFGSGIWIPWYDAQLLNDELYLVWTETTGFTGVEEEEE